MKSKGAFVPHSDHGVAKTKNYISSEKKLDINSKNDHQLFHRNSRDFVVGTCFEPFTSRQPFFVFIAWFLVIAIASTSLIDASDDVAAKAAFGSAALPVYNLGGPDATAAYDSEIRGSKKFGDPCDSSWECGFPHAICNKDIKKCQCDDRFPATNHLDKCGKLAKVNESCFFTEQCEIMTEQTECRDGKCICMFEMSPILNPDKTYSCVAVKDMPPEKLQYVDPTMIFILVVMALMFIIICIVLRLFASARWRENRTIFNTPNPRLMNVSLLRENKLLHGERRGSRMSVRMPSRQPSMASLRPHSPNASMGRAQKLALQNKLAIDKRKQLACRVEMGYVT
ncbi:uncharacterized protein LOC134834715 isoform X2 [Culicoides brevitarsis]|uniref:uncharacterized protein LOC134834715 isoform X2 n=1 Tax=Culicoides brevitarsis TaxID=469753 RepID=UPI00307B60E1